jgi:CMP/dCMP kinase
MIIAIDGPSGTGKSTVAKRVAERLGFSYFDTGAMYRAVTHCMLQENMGIDEDERIDELLRKFDFSVKEGRYFLGDEDITEAIRSQDVTLAVSAVSAMPAVRYAMVEIQRRFAANNSDAVFEGRDMGTAVFPSAHVKIFLTATPKIRAERRHKEIVPNNLEISMTEVMTDITRRDVYDSTRTASPLYQAEDAVFVESSGLSIEEVVNKILSYVG